MTQIPDIDFGQLASSVCDLFRKHWPWLSEKLGASVLSQAVKEIWEKAKAKLSSAGGREAIEKVQAQPAKERSWEYLKLHLMDALEEDPDFRAQIVSLHRSQPVQQSLHGDGNKQALIIGSPGSQIKQ